MRQITKKQEAKVVSRKKNSKLEDHE